MKTILQTNVRDAVRALMAKGCRYLLLGVMLASSVIASAMNGDSEVSKAKGESKEDFLISPNLTTNGYNSYTATYGGATGPLGYSVASNNHSTPIIYSTGDPTVATVDASGIITPTGAGSTTITVFQAANATYSSATALVTVTISLKSLIVGVLDASKNYGDPNPTFTILYNGFVNGDNASSLTTAPTASCTATTTTAPGSGVLITPGGGVSNKYSFNYNSGTLTINKAPLTVTVNPMTRVYGQSTQPTLNYSGFANAESPSNLAVQPTAGSWPASAVVGNYTTAHAAGGVSNNYAFIYPNSTITITPAPLSIVVNDATRTYGASDPVITFVYSGFVLSQTQTVLSSLPTGSFTSNSNSPVGAYAINASGAVAQNYTITTYTPGTLTITKAPLTIKANDAIRYYGDADPAPIFLYSGFRNGETASVLSFQPTSSSGTSGTTAVGNNYVITPSGAAAANYLITYVNGNLTINPAPVTIKANNASRGYGVANPTFTATVTGLKNSETVAVFSPSLYFFCNSSAGSSVGSYPITVNGGNGATNYTISSYSPGSLTVTPAPLTVTVNNATRIYGASDPTFTLTYGGFLFGEDPSIVSPAPIAASATGVRTDVGSYPITALGGTAPNYQITVYNPGTLTITPKPLTISSITVYDKVYDGLTTVTIIGGNVSGAINGDDVHPLAGSGTAAFTDPNAGNNKTVVFSNYSLAGAKANDYILATQPSNGTANITPKAVTISGVTPANKVYDGNTATTMSGGVLAGVLAADAAAVSFSSGTGNFSDQYASTGKTVTVSGYVLTGPVGVVGNYALSAQPLVISLANITPKPLTINGVTASNKVYDGTTTAILSGGTVTGAIDPITFTAGSGAFADANIGSKAVTANGYAIGGALVANYLLSAQPIIPNATISAKPITITGLSVANKVYDGTTAATLSGTPGITGVVGAEDVHLNTGGIVANFSDANVGNNKSVSLNGLSLSGTQIGNYTLNTASSVTASITKLPLTITNVSANNKTYDGTASAILTGGTLNSIIPADAALVSFTAGTGTFSDQYAGVGKSVTASNYTLTGAAAGNYSLPIQPAVANANITPKPVTVTVNAGQTKVYGTADPVFTYTVTPALLGSDAFTGSLSRVMGATPEAVGTYDIQLNTLANPNYTIATYTGNKLTITRKPLTITGVTASDKVYDGGFGAVMSAGALSPGVLASDNGLVVLVSGAGTFATKTVGTAITVTGGYSLTGTASGNYSITQPTAVAKITAKPLTITGVAASSKTYDGTSTATITGTATLNGAVAGDVVSINPAGPAAQFSDKNAGVNKPVTFGGYVLTGADAGNYTVSQPASTTASINQALLTLTPNTASRVFGAADPVFTGVYTGFANGESLANAGISGMPVFSSTATIGSSVGFYKIQVNTTGMSSVNYTIAGGADANYTITKANQIITFNPLSDQGVNAAPFAIAAASDSGLPVSFIIQSGPASISNGTITLTGAQGLVKVIASQTGDADHFAANDVEQDFNVNNNPTTAITFNDFQTTFGAQAFTPVVTKGGSTGALLFVIIPGGTGSATVSANGQSITPVSTGTVNVRVYVASDATYNGSYKDAVMTINKASQAIPALGLAASYPIGQADIVLPATAAPSGYAIAYGSNNNAVAVINNGTLHFTGGAGSVTITADQPGDANYLPATQVTATVLVDSKIIVLNGMLAFGDNIVGIDKPVKNFTIVNSGTSVLTVSAITLPAGYTSDISTASIGPASTQTVNVTFAPTVSQDYSGTITVASDATSGTNTIAVTGKGLLIAGLGDENAQEAVSAYPNPGKGVFNITLSNSDGAGVLTDAMGRSLNVQLQLVKKNLYQLDLSDKEAGVYFLQCESGKEKVFVRLVVYK